MDRLGIGYEVLANENPRLVYCRDPRFRRSAHGFKSACRPTAFDVVAQAMGGAMRHYGIRTHGRR